MTAVGKLMAVMAAGLGGLGGAGLAAVFIADPADTSDADKKAVLQTQAPSSLPLQASESPVSMRKDHSRVFSTKRDGDYLIRTKWDDNWDRRDPSSLVEPSNGDEDDLRHKRDIAAKTPRASRHLFLIRHGQYILDGATDKERVLTEKGTEQVRMTGKRLALLNFPFYRVVCSTMTRAQQTGTQILAEMKLHPLSVQVDSLLEMVSPCSAEPPHPVYTHLPSDYFQDEARIEAAFRHYVHRADVSQPKDSYEIIVSHGHVIQYFVCRALQLPPEAWLRIDLHHASITWLCIRPHGGVSLRCLGDSGHLPPKLLSN